MTPDEARAFDMLTDDEIVLYLETRGWTSERMPNPMGTAKRWMLWSPWSVPAVRVAS